ncbi:hypothetical protein ACHAXT_003314 [Thalassiosira profunda]
MATISIEANTGGGKRRKCGDDGSPAGGGGGGGGGLPSTSTVRLGDLPDVVLSHVASFLASVGTTRFALANNSRATSKAILESMAPVLDFGDVATAEAARMTDRDVAELLSFFVSRTDLRRLKLAGLVNITGVGLDPLRGYPLLEQVDLGLVKSHANPTLETAPALVPGIVINILDTIIRKKGSSLKHVQLPKHWRGGDNELVGAFLENYSRFLERRKLVCGESVFTRSTRVGDKRVEHFAKCKNKIRNEARGPPHFGNAPLISDGSFRVGYGIQNRTCSACLKTVCAECEENEFGLADYCSCCERVYCKDCQEVLYCEGDGSGRWCGVSSCITCAQVEKWNFCEDFMFCGREVGGAGTREDPRIVEPNVSYCTQIGCNKNMCSHCIASMPIEETIRYCEACDMESCRECLVRHGNGCDDCRAAFGIEAVE